MPDYDPLTGVQKSVERATRVEDLCRDLNIPGDTVKIVMVNGRRVNLEYQLEGDERVALFPPVGGG